MFSVDLDHIATNTRKQLRDVVTEGINAADKPTLPPNLTVNVRLSPEVESAIIRGADALERIADFLENLQPPVVEFELVGDPITQP